MLFDNPVADAQTEASSLAHRFCRIEGIENAVRVFNADAGIEKLDANLAIHAVNPHLQTTALAAFEDRVDSVIDDVQEHLLQLMRIGSHRRNLGRSLALEQNIVDLEVVVTQGKGLVYDLAQVDFLFLRRALPGKRQQVLDNAMCALSLLEE